MQTAKEIIGEIDNNGKTLEAGRDFVIRYEKRNQPGQDGFGARGVQSEATTALYAEALLWTVKFLNVIGLRLRKSVRPRRVYVFDLHEAVDLDGGSPQMLADPLDESRAPTFAVYLPSRTELPSGAAEKLYMQAAAVHECAHVVCFEQKGFGGDIPQGTGWQWLSEGLAEWVALRHAQATGADSWQSLEYLADWFAYPAIPMAHCENERENPDMPTYWYYRSVVFVLYLARLKDANAVADLWKSGGMAADSDPWPIIKSKWGYGIFVEFCCDAYFMGDQANRFHSPEIYQRFGPRAWEHGYVHTTSGWIDGVVHDFACRYYAVTPTPASSAITVGFNPETPYVRARVLFADAEYREVAPSILVEAGTFSIPVPAQSALDHIALMVTTEPESSRSKTIGHRFSFMFG